MRKLPTTLETSWLNTEDIRYCAYCPRYWQLRRQLRLDSMSSAQLVAEVRRLYRSADRQQRVRAATLAAELDRRDRAREDERARAQRLGVPTSARQVIGSLAGSTLVAGLGLWALAWIPAWADGPPGRIVGLLGPPALAAAVWLQWWWARRDLRPCGAVVYRHGSGLAAGEWLYDAKLRLRGRPDQVVRGMNGGLVVQQHRPHLSFGLNPVDAVEAGALAVLVEARFGEACQAAEVHYANGVQPLPIGPGARESVRVIVDYMRKIDAGAEPAPIRADRACVRCEMRLLCPEGQDAAARSG